MITPNVKFKNQARKTAHSAYSASRSKGKSAPRSRTKTFSDGEATSEHSAASSRAKDTPLRPDELDKIDAYWRAANYQLVRSIFMTIRS
jgi:hypothetical protein